MIILSNFYYVLSDDINTGGPRIVAEGEDALLTCVVMSSYRNDTVLWKKGTSEILSAGLNRVTKDKVSQNFHGISFKIYLY